MTLGATKYLSNIFVELTYFFEENSEWKFKSETFYAPHPPPAITDIVPEYQMPPQGDPTSLRGFQSPPSGDYRLPHKGIPDSPKRGSRRPP